MNLTYEYRLFTRKAEERALDPLLEQAREVYNAALAQAQVAWNTQQVTEGGLSQWPYFREWRKQPGILLNASSLQHLLRRLDKAYSAFFRRMKAGQTPGHPRLKPSQRFNSIEYTDDDGCKFTPNDGEKAVLYIQNVGQIKVKFHRPLPEDSTIKHVLLKRKNRRWYIYLMLELPDSEFVPNGNPAVGGDMGLLRLLTLSDDTLLDNPRWMRIELKHLRVAQRQFRRRKKGSKRRRKAAYRVARIHEHVAISVRTSGTNLPAGWSTAMA